MKDLCWLILAVIAPVSVATATEPEEPQVVSSLRVEPLWGAETGVWIDLVGYQEIGSPTFSPDGMWIAFDAREKGFYGSDAEVWIVGRKGNDLRKLVVGATPRWSPDGKHLLFKRERSAEPTAKLGVFVIDQDGRNEKWICEGRWPDWAPDGKHIAFSRTSSKVLHGGVKPQSQIYIAGADGSDTRLICDGDGPSWSPDGKMLACCQRDPAYRAPIVRIVDMESKQQTIIGYGWFRANWLPDGKSVVANGVSAEGATAMVKFSTEKPSKPEIVCREFPDGLSPCYSHDGKYVVFVGKRPESGKRPDRGVAIDLPKHGGVLPPYSW
jgi:Tol biopolymer transport system component